MRRTHGGARIVTPKSDEFAFSARDTHQLSEKELIGRACAELIGTNQSVILDAGTTVYHVARHLEEKAPQIVTNSLPIANLFASASKVEVILAGGVIYPRLGVLVGPMTVEAFSKMRADVAIMSAGGITLEGITNSHTLLIDIQRAMLKARAENYFLSRPHEIWPAIRLAAVRLGHGGHDCHRQPRAAWNWSRHCANAAWR